MGGGGEGIETSKGRDLLLTVIESDKGTLGTIINFHIEYLNGVVGLFLILTPSVYCVKIDNAILIVL